MPALRLTQSISWLLLVFFTALCFITGCESPPTCDCPEKLISDKVSIRSISSDSLARGGEISGDVSIPFRKLIEAHISAKGSIHKSTVDVKEVYSEIIGHSPDITQRANLFRGIACWKYIIICEDQSLSASEKRNMQMNVVEVYETNIEDIYKEEKSVEKEQLSGISPGGSTTPGPTRLPSTTTHHPTTPPATEKNYFNNQYATDVALIVTGEAIGNAGQMTEQALIRQQWNTTQAYFRPAFLNDHVGRLNKRDITMFTDYELLDELVCVCHLNQGSISWGSGSLSGATFTKATAHFELTVFNLRTGKINSLNLDVTGAGVNKAQALAGVDEKLEQKLDEFFPNLSSCKK